MEAIENAGAYLLDIVSQVFAVLIERPGLTIIVFASLILIVWRVERAQRELDRLIEEQPWKDESDD